MPSSNSQAVAIIVTSILHINVENISPDNLRLRYIPNLRDGWETEEKEQQLTALLLIELLAYQFASLVRWIETQNIIFSPPYDFERLIEFGPSPTLVGMAQRTHKLKYAKADLARGKRRVMLCHQEAICYSFADAEEDGSTTAEQGSAPETSAPGPAAVAAPSPAPIVSASPAAAAASVPDEPLKATDTIRAILAQKLKKPIADIPLSKAIEDMVSDKSTLQNELIGDLQLGAKILW
ncbi:unnamed protein product [Tilletia controversa]|nr:unnamed protein product [Tilletia controversa]